MSDTEYTALGGRIDPRDATIARLERENNDLRAARDRELVVASRLERENASLRAAAAEILTHERNASHADLDQRYDAEAWQRLAEQRERELAEARATVRDGAPDYCHDEEWEWTSQWKDRNDLVEDGIELGEVVTISTLYRGADRYVALAEYGKPQWFDAFADAEAFAKAVVATVGEDDAP